MTTQNTLPNRREAVAVCRSADEFREAFRRLRKLGFTREDIRLVADPLFAEQQFGNSLDRMSDVAETEDGPHLQYLRREPLSPGACALLGGGIAYLGIAVAVVLAIRGYGEHVLTALLATIGTGVLAFWFLGLARRWMDSYAYDLARELQRGGLLMWVRVPDEQMEEKALGVLTTHGLGKVNVIPVPLA